MREKFGSDAVRLWPRAMCQPSSIAPRTEARFRLLGSGRFLTVSTASALRFPVQSQELKALPIELPVSPVPVCIVTLRHRVLNPTAPLFIQHAREVAKLLAGAII